jgi:hypothetical protein
MKRVAIFLVFLTMSTLTFSQSPDYSVVLNTNESFIKISRQQIADSVNLNQKGPEQFELGEIYLSKDEEKTVDLFMKNCKSIQSIIEKYGKVEFDVSMRSSNNVIEPLSGFYYSVENIKTNSGYQLTLAFIYPRVDPM